MLAVMTFVDGEGRGINVQWPQVAGVAQEISRAAMFCIAAMVRGGYSEDDALRLAWEFWSPMFGAFAPMFTPVRVSRVVQPQRIVA